jgi:peptidoglycan/xylan/chitin deacetylase (PgdA/CDA1 family)
VTLPRFLTGLASRGGRHGRLLAFFFHRVLEKPDPMMPGEPDARRFDRMLSWIGEQFRVLPPLAACEQLSAGRLPARAAIISFDDGYRDNHDVALPILKRHGMPAAFFIATGYLGDGVQFNDRLVEAFRELRADAFDAQGLGLGTLPTATPEAKLRALERVREAIKYLEPAARSEAVERVEKACGAAAAVQRRPRIMMTPEEVKALAANGMEIGGHTVTHPILRSVDDATAAAEIRSGREALASVLDRPPTLFAYPNGRPGRDFDRRHAEMAREAGFAYAFSTERGVATAATDPMMLPRFMPWDTERWRFELQALKVVIGR